MHQRRQPTGLHMGTQGREIGGIEDQETPVALAQGNRLILIAGVDEAPVVGAEQRVQTLALNEHVRLGNHGLQGAFGLFVTTQVTSSPKTRMASCMWALNLPSSCFIWLMAWKWIPKS